jgi:hypothetical protein
MADQLDNNTRSPNPDVEIDDPLAELAGSSVMSGHPARR